MVKRSSVIFQRRSDGCAKDAKCLVSLQWTKNVNSCLEGASWRFSFTWTSWPVVPDWPLVVRWRRWTGATRCTSMMTAMMLPSSPDLEVVVSRESLVFHSSKPPTTYLLLRNVRMRQTDQVGNNQNKYYILSLSTMVETKQMLPFSAKNTTQEYNLQICSCCLLFFRWVRPGVQQKGPLWERPCCSV